MKFWILEECLLLRTRHCYYDYCGFADLCNGKSLAEMDTKRGYKEYDYNSVDNYYPEDKQDYDQYYKREEERFEYITIIDNNRSVYIPVYHKIIVN